MPRAPQSAKRSSVRPYYLFTAVVFAIGMVLSVIAESWSSFFVFAVLCLMFVWVAARVDRDRISAAAPQGGERLRPSERRRRRKQQD